MNNSVALKSILLLTANPKGTNSLRLHEEEREIKERLRLAGYGKVPINSTGASRPKDIYQSMLDFQPQIVHFSGHGAGQDGLVFEDVTGQVQFVSSEALANLFSLFSKQVECVILNACYSRDQAEKIAQHIEYVIGTSQAIGDSAAIEFAVGFYTGLGAGMSVEFAYELGCIAIQLEGIPEHFTPVLFKKGQKIENRNERSQYNQSSQDQTPDTFRNMHYNKLEYLLAQGFWEEADRRTTKIMLEIAKRENKGDLDEESLFAFPTSDLLYIDNLWRKYSREKFGFSVQKEIFCTSGQDVKKFAKLVGWKDKTVINDYFSWKKQHQIEFQLDSALSGHLPWSWANLKNMGFKNIEVATDGSKKRIEILFSHPGLKSV